MSASSWITNFLFFKKHKEIDNPNSDEIIGYRIYRKTLFSNYFMFFSENTGKENKVFYDNQVLALHNYSYY
jgi:hypothetical protein